METHYRLDSHLTEEQMRLPGGAGFSAGGAGDPTKIGNYGHICLLRDIAQAVRDGRSPAIPPQEAALAVRVICSIYESTRTGRPIVF